MSQHAVNVKYTLLCLLCSLFLIACNGGGGGSKDENPTLSTISVSSFSKNLKIGEAQQLTATGTLSDDSTEDISNDVTWSSSEPSIATVSEVGLVTSISAGNVTISATFEDIVDSTQGTMIALQSLVITPISNLDIGNTTQLSVTGTYTDSSSVDLSSFSIWTSSNTDRLSSSETGFITAIVAGTITVSANYFGTIATTDVTINTPDIPVLSSIAISEFSGTLKTGVTEQFSATATYSDSSTEDVSNTAIWSSSNTNIASITSSGLLSAISSGSVAITASFDGLSSTSSGSIKSLTTLSITPVSGNLKIGENEQLTATGTYSDSSTEDFTTVVSWASSDTNIASISNAGLLTSIVAGTVTLTASSDGIDGLLNATMIDLSSISISPPSSILAKSSTQQFIATGIYTDNTTEDLSTSVTWSTQDSGLATTSNAGLLNAIAAGSTSIIASLGNVTGNASITVSAATLQQIEITASNEIPVGSSEQAIATGIYNDSSTQDITNQVTWSVDNNTIASIDINSGLIDFIQAGNIIINAELEGITAQASVTINSALITSIAITPSNLSLAAGTMTDISIVAIFSDNSYTDISAQVEWSSDNASVANIENFNSNVSANTIGSAIITASFSDQTADLAVTVSSATLDSINISPVNATIPAGLSQVFTANGLYSDGSIQDITSQVTWTTSDDSLTSIGNSTTNHGIAQTLAIGTATIEAIIGEVSQSTSLIIENITLSSIELSPPTQSLPIGLSKQIDAYGHFSDGSIIEINDLVSWSSTQPDTASFSASQPGTITASSEGSTIISAALEGITALGEITATTATLQSITITTPSPSLPSGYEQTLTATGNYTDESTSDISQVVTWQSSEPSILSIDTSSSSFGLAIGMSTGSATVSASFNNISANTDITVTSATLSSITISLEKISLNEKAQTAASALATYSDASEDDITQQVIWNSNNPNIASIQNTLANRGLITGQSAGSVTISASLNGVNSQGVNLEITENPNTPLSLALSVTPYIIIANSTDPSTIEATVQPVNESGTIVDGTTVLFTITEGDTISTQRSDTVNGVAPITITSTYQGLITIVASIEDDNIANSAGIFSTNNLANVISIFPSSNTAYSEGVLFKGSQLILLMRNISNRTFTYQQVEVSYGSENTRIEFFGSPYTALEQIGDGILSAGDISFFGYQLDDDIEASLFHIIYSLTDESSGTTFEKHIDYIFE